MYKQCHIGCNGGGHMEGRKQEFDMELTDKRFEAMKELLLRLAADQRNAEVVSVEVRPATKEETA